MESRENVEFIEGLSSRINTKQSLLLLSTTTSDSSFYSAKVSVFFPSIDFALPSGVRDVSLHLEATHSSGSLPFRLCS